MDVYWLEQSEADLPAQNQWLSTRERESLSRMRFAKRHNDWRLGRWTAKHAMAACLGFPHDLCALANLEILAGPSGAPEVFLSNQIAPVAISISHRSGVAMCAVALSADCVGCDVELIEPRSDAFTADYFTANERTMVETTSVEEQPLLVTLLWSAKESALKALHMGLRLDTKSLDVSVIEELSPYIATARHLPSVAGPLSSDDWHPLFVRYSDSQVFYGWWRQANHLVRTIVSALPLRPPIHSAS